MKKRILCLLFLISIISGCISKEEERERQKNAFDVSGQYVTDRENSEINMLIDIDNENGRHDILVKITRNGELTEKEINFFNKFDLDIDRVKSNFANSLVLGKGKQFTFEGGENISDDFGKTSKIFVYSETLNFDSDYTVTYNFHATISKKDFNLKGYLSISLIEKTYKTKKDGTIIKENIHHNESISFITTSNSSFYTQYFGNWSGKTRLIPEFSDNYLGIKNFHIKKSDNNYFHIDPVMKAITLNAEKYYFQKQNFPIKELSDLDFPIIELIFKSTDNKNIIYWGTIYGLGNLSGIIIFSTESIERPIGNFKFNLN